MMPKLILFSWRVPCCEKFKNAEVIELDKTTATYLKSLAHTQSPRDFGQVCHIFIHFTSLHDSLKY